MNNIKQAWLALFGCLESRVITKTVIGDAAMTDLYEARDPSVPYSMGADGKVIFSNPVEFYTSCKGAFQNHPDRRVTKIRAIKIGDSYFRAGNEIKVGRHEKKGDAE